MSSKADENGMRDEYDFSRGVRGKYFRRYQRMRLKVLLDPDVARVFPDSKAVNEALRRLPTGAPSTRMGTTRRGGSRTGRKRKAG